MTDKPVMTHVEFQEQMAAMSTRLFELSAQIEDTRRKGLALLTERTTLERERMELQRSFEGVWWREHRDAAFADHGFRPGHVAAQRAWNLAVEDKGDLGMQEVLRRFDTLAALVKSQG